MANVDKSGAVLFAKNLRQMASFYEAVAGMKVTHLAKDIIVLESPGHQLVIHPIAPKIARTILISVPPKRRTNSAVKLVFAVPSIAAARAQAPALGGELNPPRQMFEARGFRACDGHDPEGNVIQFREDAASPARTLTRKAAAKSGVDFEVVRKIALGLPETVVGSTLRGISFKSRGKLLACKAVHRSAEPESLVVRVDATDRDRLLAQEPEIYYLPEHYRMYSSVLVRLKRIDRKALQSLLEIAWQFVTAAAPGDRKPAKRKKASSVFRYL